MCVCGGGCINAGENIVNNVHIQVSTKKEEIHSAENRELKGRKQLVCRKQVSAASTKPGNNSYECLSLAF